MTDIDVVVETINSGIEPLCLAYYPIKSTNTRNEIAFRSILIINSLELGVLMPDDYKYVASRTVQSQKLAIWNLRELCSDIKTLCERNYNFKWISVSIPVRMVLRTNLKETLLKTFEECEFNFLDKICLEFPAELLLEDRSKIVPILTELREAGFKLSVFGFGDEFCPTFRIKDIPFDYVIFDRFVTENLDEKSESPLPSSLVSFVSSLNIQPIIDFVTTDEQVREANRLECYGYIKEDSLIRSNELIIKREEI